MDDITMVDGYNMGLTHKDYPYTEFPTVMAAIYIVLCVTALLINLILVVFVLRSKRILGSPKYWLVLASSITFIFQSSVTNNILVFGWLTKEYNPGIIWKMSVVFNRYIGMGIVTWTSFLINLDYLICMKSAAYTRYYRIIVTPFLMIVTCVPMLATVITLSVINEKIKSTVFVILDESSHQILLWVTLFGPLILNFICGSAVLIWRCSAKLQQVIVANEDISDPVDISNCPFLPPPDHITFIFALVLFYLPVAILEYDPIWSDESHQVRDFRIMCTILRDNASSIAPLAWFMFKDIRVICKKCVTIIKNTHLDDLTESSEMSIYDSYPYCNRIQI